MSQQHLRSSGFDLQPSSVQHQLQNPTNPLQQQPKGQQLPGQTQGQSNNPPQHVDPRVSLTHTPQNHGLAPVYPGQEDERKLAPPTGSATDNPKFDTESIHAAKSVIRASIGFLTRIEHRHREYGYFSLFRFSTKHEKLFMIIGLIFALAAGICMPLMVWRFGLLTNSMVLIDMIRTDKNFNNTYKDKTPFCLEMDADLTEIFELRGDETDENRNRIITNRINLFVIWHTVFAAALTFFSVVYFICWFVCGENQINRLSVAYFEAMLRKDMKWLDTRKEDVDYINGIVDHTQRIRDGIGERVASAAFLISVFCAAMALAFSFGWELTLVAFVAIPLLIASTSIVATTEANQVVEESAAYSKAGALAEEVLLNIRTVMVYGGQKKEFANFHQRIDLNKDKILKRAVYTSLANGLTWFLTYANYALSFWYGTKLVLENRVTCTVGQPSYTPADLVIIFFGIMFGAINIGLAFPIVESMLVAGKSAKEVFQIIDTTSEVDNLSLDGHVPSHPAKGEVQFIDVCFTYPARRNVPILRGVSFNVTPGMTVAMVGTSGCGKSTILKLLTKEYLSDSGFIKLDGTDLRAYNTVWLRNQIAVVTQESSLFDDSIEENVKIGSPHASFAEVQAACKAANAHDFICQLKNGYQTVVGFQGSKLSGGQRQRISIARALIRNPKVLLLDEPTSALDNQSEAVVQEALKKASVNRTTFVVAHRLNTIINSDLILVFDHGHIIERGTHTELLAQKGLYFQLATGIHSQSSPIGPKLDLDRVSAAARRRASRASVKTLDNIITSPYRNGSITYSVSDKVTRHLRQVTEKPAEADPDDEVIFSINNLQGEGDSRLRPTAAANYGKFQPRITGHIPSALEHTVHVESELSTENMLWQRYTRGIEQESRIEILPPGQYEPPQQIQEPPAQPHKFQFFPVLRMVSLNPILIAFGVIGSIGMGCTLPLYGLLFGEIVGALSNPDEDEGMEATTMFSLLFLVVGVLAGISVFTQSLTLGLAGVNAVNRLRKRLLFAILRQDVGWFDDPDNGVSTLNTRLNTDAASTQYVVLSFYGVLIQCVATVAIAICYCFFFAPRLTAYCLFLVPIVIGASWLDGWLSKRQEEKTSLAMDNISKIVLEVFQNRRVVLTSQLERYFIAKYERALKQSGKSHLSIAITRGFAYGFAQAAAFWTYSVCIFLAGFELTRKDDKGKPAVQYRDVLKVGDGLIFALITVGTSLAILPNFVKAIAAANRILRILRNRPRFDFDMGGDFMPITSGAMEFHDVNFWYPHANDIHILKGISFSVKPGEMVALVGSSGSGKSTCVQLILRFHDCSRGSITLDGQDIKRLNCASMRSHMALVEQEPRLFDRSVAENIAYGDNTKAISMQEIIAAAKAANIHVFITSLPEGYQTRVGDRLLSGGQKQRIAIARALLRNPQILILDEATAALDRESEKIVKESLEVARRGRSCIAVAHRLSSIQQADLIVVMHQGTVLEFGNHEDLLKKNGLYALLWMAQNPLAVNEKNTSTSRKMSRSGSKAQVQKDLVERLAGFAATAVPTPNSELVATNEGQVDPATAASARLWAMCNPILEMLQGQQDRGQNPGTSGAWWNNLQ